MHVVLKSPKVAIEAMTATKLYQGVNIKLNLKDPLYIILLAGVYFFSAKAGLSLAMVHSQISAIWPPTGLSIAFLLIFGVRYWPGIFIGAFLANLTASGTGLTSLLIAMGNTLEGVAGAFFINKFAGGRRAFENLQNVIKFIFFGGAVSPIVSATIGVTTLFIAGTSNFASYFTAWFTWWLGDASSVVVMVPFIVLWANNPRLQFTRQQVFEIILVLISIGVLARTIFGGLFFQYINYPLEFLVMPILAWISIRFNPRETMTSVIIIALIASWGTIYGYGPFIGSWSANNSLIFLQSFLMTIAATSLALAVTVWERKEGEKALHKADQVKDEFLTTLSHELRNPLASVFGYLQLIQIGSAKYAKKKKAIENIESDLRHVSSLLDDLLDLSRVRRGKIRLQKELAEVNLLVKEVVANMKPIIEENKQILNIEKSEEPVWIDADVKRVKQILVNLISNAAKYTEPGGSISISVFKKEDFVHIEVRDKGQGMSPDMLSKIFDMFNQEGKPATRTARGFRGLGIGLTVVKKFVELHGGDVIASSEGLGKGSTFTVTFPASKKTGKINQEEKHKTTAETLIQEKAKVQNRKLSVMVVDDNERAADSLAELLTHFGHYVTVSYSGVDALRTAQKTHPNVAILDIGLPDIDGYEVGRELRKRYKELGDELLLMALSGYGQPEDIKRSQEAGFDHHLVKPVDIMVLQEILQAK
jgi:signal transduction histidine kinase/CheY-like chemotaxis protein